MRLRLSPLPFGALILIVLVLCSSHVIGAQDDPLPADSRTAVAATTSDRSWTEQTDREIPEPEKNRDQDTGWDDEFAFTDEQAPVSPVQIADPLEPLNRVMFQFNDKLYFWLLKPMAQGYNFVMPKDFRLCIANFFSNLLTPVRLMNCILQGKMKNAETEVARFCVNSTIGILGFGDPGKQMFDMDISDEDLGQTLGVWGFGQGFYIVWPVLSSSTLRESLGFLGDLWVNPIGYLETAADIYGVGLYRRFNDLSFRIGEYEAIKEASLEPYTAVRSGYVQFRNTLVDR